MRFQIGDIINSPYPNDSSVGLIVEEVESYDEQANPFRSKLYPHGYYRMLILEDGLYMNWDAKWVEENSEKLA